MTKDQSIQLQALRKAKAAVVGANVSIPADVHETAKKKARRDGITLEQAITLALAAWVKS